MDPIKKKKLLAVLESANVCIENGRPSLALILIDYCLDEINNEPLLKK